MTLRWLSATTFYKHKWRQQVDEFQHRTESRQWMLSCGVSGLWVSARRPLASEDILELEDRGW
jgi:hypothetical protein